MKISSKFPQFKKEHSLIIVAGVYKAIFYLAYDGEINNVAGFEFKKVKYESEKDIYLKAGSAISVRGGLVSDNDDQKIAADEFAKNFKTTFDKFFKKEKIDSIYIFAPDKTLNRIPKLLPTNLKKKIKFNKEGNYLKKHPFEIIEMIERL